MLGRHRRPPPSVQATSPSTKCTCSREVDAQTIHQIPSESTDRQHFCALTTRSTTDRSLINIATFVPSNLTDRQEDVGVVQDIS